MQSISAPISASQNRERQALNQQQKKGGRISIVNEDLVISFKNSLSNTDLCSVAPIELASSRNDIMSRTPLPRQRLVF